MSLAAHEVISNQWMLCQLFEWEGKGMHVVNSVNNVDIC